MQQLEIKFFWPLTEQIPLDLDFTPSEDQDIQGKMLTVTNVIKQYDLEILPEDEIKRKMIYELAEEMAKSNMVEFTKQIDPVNHCVNIRARCFMVPDTHVRILREKGIK